MKSMWMVCIVICCSAFALSAAEDDGYTTLPNDFRLGLKRLKAMYDRRVDTLWNASTIAAADTVSIVTRLADLTQSDTRVLCAADMPCYALQDFERFWTRMTLLPRGRKKHRSTGHAINTETLSTVRYYFGLAEGTELYSDVWFDGPEPRDGLVRDRACEFSLLRCIAPRDSVAVITLRDVIDYYDSEFKEQLTDANDDVHMYFVLRDKRWRLRVIIRWTCC